MHLWKNLSKDSEELQSKYYLLEMSQDEHELSS